MSVPPAPATRRFRRDALNPRARGRLLAGLALLLVAAIYGTWAAQRLGVPGAEEGAPDGPVVRVATRMTAPLRRHVPPGEPRTEDELLLQAIVRDQQDVVFGLTVLVLRFVAAGTVAALGLVLLTAGSTEWELRTETANRTAVA